MSHSSLVLILLPCVLDLARVASADHPACTSSNCSAPEIGASQQSLSGGALLIQAHTRLRSLRDTGDTAINVTLEVDTSTEDYAQTETPVLVAFVVGGAWTQDSVLCSRAALSEVIIKEYSLLAWPSKLRLKAGGTDAFGYTRILLRTGSNVVTVLSASDGNKSYGAGSVHWVDGNEEAPKSNVYDVSRLAPASKNATAQVNCTTRYDPRAAAMGYSTSPPGTPCIFGLDPRDEGSHCIMNFEEYGSYGWCWTSNDKYSWGSCSEDCPLFGQAKILGDRIERLREEIKTEHEDAALELEKGKQDNVGDAVIATNISNASTMPNNSSNSSKLKSLMEELRQLVELQKHV